MDILLVLPTYNEEKIIGQNIDRVFNFCQKNLTAYQWMVVIADNGSFDKTLEIVQQKKQIHPNLKYFHLTRPGKGKAIKKAWQDYTARINIFMDADLSTELKFIPPLIKAIGQKNYGIAIGSRYQEESQLKRPAWRSLLSRSYNLILKLFFHLNLTDAQCGFKAVSQKVVRKVIPKIKNNQLFFDTELLVLGHYANFLIKEIPVNWQERKGKSKIKIIPTAFNYLKEIIKLKLRPTKM